MVVPGAKLIGRRTVNDSGGVVSTSIKVSLHRPGSHPKFRDGADRTNCGPRHYCTRTAIGGFNVSLRHWCDVRRQGRDCLGRLQAPWCSVYSLGGGGRARCSSANGSSVKAGDVFFIKSYPPQIGLQIKAVGIVIEFKFSRNHRRSRVGCERSLVGRPRRLSTSLPSPFWRFPYGHFSPTFSSPLDRLRTIERSRRQHAPRHALRGIQSKGHRSVLNILVPAGRIAA